MKVKLLSENAKLPVKGDSFSAGYDLYASESITVEAWSRSLVSTGISLEIPENFYGRIAPRSGLGLKGFDIGSGVIDSSYRGEIKVVFVNATSSAYSIQVGDRIAQIIFEMCLTFPLEIASTLSETERGESGFGSTGK